MDSLTRIVEGALTGGFSRAIAYVLIVVLGIALVWGLQKYIRWRIRRAIKRRAEAIFGAPGRAVQGLVSGASYAASNVAGTVSGGVSSAVNWVTGRKPDPEPEPKLFGKLSGLRHWRKS